MTFFYFIFGLLILGIVIAVIWRISSRQHTLPCPVWLSWLIECDNPFTKINRASFIVEHLNLKPGMHVLDAGCGPGRLTIPIAKKISSEGSVTAMDMQPGMLSRVKEKAMAAHLSNIHLLLAKLGEGKLKHGQYDRALLVTVLGEIPDRESALKEIFDALKPGGILAVTEFIFDPHFQRRRTVLELARKASFQEKQMIGHSLAFILLLEKPPLSKS